MSRPTLTSVLMAWRKWQGKEQPGFWIDMDMIPFGQLQLMSPPGAGSGSHGQGRHRPGRKGCTPLLPAQ